MKYIALLLSISFCGFIGNFSSYSDNKSYANDIEARYLIIEPSHELSIGASEKNLMSGRIRTLNLSFDYMPNATYSPFVFVGVNDNEIIELNSIRSGVGIAWLASESLLKFPYRNKLSYALVSDSNKSGLVHSIRWKLKGYFEKIGFDSTVFYLGYGETVDVRLAYKLNNNFDLINKFYYERNEKNTYNSNSFGVEVKF